MQALKLPATRGASWLVEGYKIYRKNQLMFSLLVLCYWLVLLFMSALPVVGQIIATVSVPIFAVSLMNACLMVERGEPIKLQVLFSGAHENLPTLLKLGVIYLLALMLILGVSSLADDGALLGLFFSGQEVGEEMLKSNAFILAVEIALALVSLLMMAFWYAPVLVAWHGLSAGKSMFFSFFACARNWRAFLVYGAVVVCGMFLPGLVLAMLSALFSGISGLFSIIGKVIAVYVLLPTVYASFYVSYRDVFVAVDDDA